MCGASAEPSRAPEHLAQAIIWLIDKDLLDVAPGDTRALTGLAIQEAEQAVMNPNVSLELTRKPVGTERKGTTWDDIMEGAELDDPLVKLALTNDTYRRALVEVYNQLQRRDWGTQTAGKMIEAVAAHHARQV